VLFCSPPHNNPSAWTCTRLNLFIIVYSTTSTFLRNQFSLFAGDLSDLKKGKSVMTPPNDDLASRNRDESLLNLPTKRTLWKNLVSFRILKNLLRLCYSTYINSAPFSRTRALSFLAFYLHSCLLDYFCTLIIPILIQKPTLFWILKLRPSKGILVYILSISY
jgi:hypothetical protein